VVEPSPRAEGTRVLIVEDDPGIAQTLRRTLRRRGYEAAIVPDGDRALARLAAATFAAVVTDLRLDHGPGGDLVRALRRQPGFRPWVLYTGIPAAGEDGHHPAGAFGVLFTGGVGEELLRAVEAACRAATPVWRARCA